VLLPATYGRRLALSLIRGEILRAVSRENVENHQRAIEAFNRRDLDAFLVLTDAGAEFAPSSGGMEGGGVYRGHAGVRKWWSDLLEVLPDFRLEIEETRDLGAVTVVHARNRGQGATSGASFERGIWHVVEWREGKGVWWQAFQSEAEALEAAGLRE
jgi:ketosteroid isomerase-like protein